MNIWKPKIPELKTNATNTENISTHVQTSVQYHSPAASKDQDPTCSTGSAQFHYTQVVKRRRQSLKILQVTWQTKVKLNQISIIANIFNWENIFSFNILNMISPAPISQRSLNFCTQSNSFWFFFHTVIW